MKLIFTATLLALFFASPALAHARWHHGSKHGYHHGRLHPMVSSLGCGLAHVALGGPECSDQPDRVASTYAGPGSIPTYSQPLGGGFDRSYDSRPNIMDVPPSGWPFKPIRHTLGTALVRGLNQVGEIVSHPSGCPRRAFCGCGVADRVFGRPVRGLWLARAWFKFPRGAVAAGNVAVRNHHVQYIERVESGVPICYDPNSGHHLTRIHPCNLAGYSIRDPRG